MVSDKSSAFGEGAPAAPVAAAPAHGPTQTALPPLGGLPGPGEVPIGEITRGLPAVSLPKSSTENLPTRYGLGQPVQLGPKTAALFCNLRVVGPNRTDYEDGSDAFVFEDLADTAGLEPGLEYGWLEHKDSIRLYDLMLRPMQKTGVCQDADVKPYEKCQRYGLRLRGYLRVPADGMYHFTVETPVYAYLFIRNAVRDLQLPPVAAAHYKQKQGTGSVALKAGLHCLEIQFMRSWGSENKLAVEVEGPGTPRQPLPAAWLYHRTAGD